MSLPKLFHVREHALPLGSLIEPGRWGRTVLAQGTVHPFFFREHLLEVWRVRHTSVGVSRFSCIFAHEGREQAEGYAMSGEAVLQVDPINSNAPFVRVDMLWVTWMGEPGATTKKIMQWCDAYWAGKSTADVQPNATPMWEWLFQCPLRVIG